MKGWNERDANLRWNEYVDDACEEEVSILLNSWVSHQCSLSRPTRTFSGVMSQHACTLLQEAQLSRVSFTPEVLRELRHEPHCLGSSADFGEDIFHWRQLQSLIKIQALMVSGRLIGCKAAK